jgi:hypothetical protein
VVEIFATTRRFERLSRAVLGDFNITEDESMKIYKVLPDLSRSKHMAIWHKALRSQWSAEDINWDRPHRITSSELKDQMSRVLTPILMGEQAALYSVSSLIPVLGSSSEVESQFYLTTWAVDEARHTELFARFYGRLDREPLPIRRFPSGYLFQSKIVSADPAEWLSGVLVSEVLAKLILEEFVRLDLDPVLSDICQGILEDEARHLGFNQIYLEDRFCGLFIESNGSATEAGDSLKRRLHDVLAHVPPMFDAVASELAAIGIDREEILSKLGRDAARRLDRSIERGRKLAAKQLAATGV